MSGHTGPVVSLAFDSVSRLVVSGSRDGTCRIWDLAIQGTCVSTLACHEGGTQTVAFVSAAGTLMTIASQEPQVVTAGVDGKVKVWDARSGAQIAALDGHTSSVGHVSTVASDARGANIMITAGADGAIRAWDARGGWSLLWARGEAHKYAVASIKANGEYVLSGGADGMARLWDLETGRMVKELGKEGHSVYNVAFKQDDCKDIIVLWRQDSSTFLDVSLVFYPLLP